MRLCIVALLVFAGGTAGAADRDTLTLGGTGTAASAATEDSELAHGRYRGYYGWGGGFGYRGYYPGFYSYSFYRPAHFNSFYYAPPAFSTFYVAPRPVFYTAPVYYYTPGVSFYIGIGGGAGTAAPAVNLGAPMQVPAQPGGLRYDGGPANPVPLPKPDAQPIPGADPTAATALPIGAKPATPFRYKAYGEK